MLTLDRRGRVAVAGISLLAIPALDLVVAPQGPETMHLVAALLGLLLLAVSAKR